MATSLGELFECLSDLSKLGSKGWISLEKAVEVVKKLKVRLGGHQEGEQGTGNSDVTAEVVGESSSATQRILTVAQDLMSLVDVNSRYDVRLECGCLALSILQEILHQLEKESAISSSVQVKTTERSREKMLRDNQAPPPPGNLISVQQTKITEDAAQLVFYTTVLSCLDAEASLYVKMTLAKNKFVLGTDLLVVPPDSRHNLLVAVMKILLPVLKHETLGVGLRRSFYAEVLSATLELCFAPPEVKTYPEDTAFFRGHLEDLETSLDVSLTLKHLLLLMGIVQGGVWLKKVCGLLVLRRFLMKPGGVEQVVGAGLSICDGQDWRRCEAVATMIARAKTNDLDGFYATVGPQVCELVRQDSLKPDVFRVVVLVVAQLAERSPRLAGLHVTNSLLQPLINTTQPDAVRLCRASNLTRCVTRVHKLFVEISPPSATLMGLLQQVLHPLMTLSALATTHLRSLARQIIVRYLSQLSRENVVDTLLVLSSLKTSPLSPPVHPGIRFAVDDSGGVKVEEYTESHERTFLEEDENLSLCLTSVLETLKDSGVVLMFYEKLASFIDLSSLNKGEVSSSMLFTDEDVKLKQVEEMRRIALSCCLLTHLSENEQVANDVFVDLSAAVPFVNTLVRVGCQKCEEEHRNLQVTLVMNVSMLVSYYVGERTLLKKMSSEDWKALKTLLPSLEEVTQNMTDEGVLLCVEQLRNLILTHGVVSTPVGSSPGCKKSEKKDSVTQKQDVDSSSSSTCSSVNVVDFNKKLKLETDVEKCTKNVADSSDINKRNVDTGINTGASTGNELAAENVKPKIKKENSGVQMSYSEAMEDLFSPLLPIRGHALLALGKLVEEHDQETLAHRERLLSVFQHNLKEDDSYLYLMAVQGLAVLCDAFPDKVVEMLTQEFSIGRRSVEDRAKLAEVLTRATRRLGSLLPYYKDHFVNALLTGVRDDEAIVRAASLSALGDVCKLLRFSLGPVIHEVFAVLYSVVKNDTAPEVRRAAVLVVTLLLQGLGRDAFTVLQGVMRDLYRALRLLHTTDPDDVVKLHAQLAMEEIDTITREFLLPKLSLTKNIYVADVPPSSF